MDWTRVLTYALVGLVLLVVLWPTMSGARRFLKRWGVPDPDEEQARLAVRYLLNRRLFYPPLFLLAPLVVPSDWGSEFFVPLIVALLLAEAIGAVWPSRGPRVARLTPRRWPDLVQRWAVWFMVALGVVALVMAVMGAVLQQWADRVVGAIPLGISWRSEDGDTTTMTEQLRDQLQQPTWLIVVSVVVVGLASTISLVWLTVSRPSIPDPRVDAALRTRTARVAVGVGIAAMASAVVLANSRLQFLREVHAPEAAPAWLTRFPFDGMLGFIVLLVGVAGWYWVGNPGNRMPYVQSSR